MGGIPRPINVLVDEAARAVGFLRYSPRINNYSELRKLVIKLAKAMDAVAKAAPKEPTK